MTNVARGNIRDIARAAVTTELAEVAINLFEQNGFDAVTINDIAATAGVSRSTFLRYFASKEGPVLGVIDAQGDQVVAALLSRPHSEDDWTSLRFALDALAQEYRRNSEETLRRTQLIYRTPSLCSGCRERQANWRPRLAAILMERSPNSPVATLVRAAAAIDCLNIAAEIWSISNGTEDLADLLDRTFAAMRQL